MTMRGYIQTCYDRIFGAEHRDQEWTRWHARTADALARSAEFLPKELACVSERKYYSWLADDVLNLLGQTRSSIGTIAEIGCGSAALSHQLMVHHSQAQSYLIDNSEVALAYAQQIHRDTHEQIHCIVGDARNLPLRDQSIDFAHTVGLIEHFDDNEILQSITEIRRILSAHGCAFIAVPNFFCPDIIATWRRYGKGSERFLTPSDLESFVHHAGMGVLHSGYSSYVFDQQSALSRIPKNLEKFLGKRGLGFLAYVLARK
jgi:2-polyprenyl-3-methyl-5-hydroxy-6-metoxy-1,4-benzoquinol methylase